MEEEKINKVALFAAMNKECDLFSSLLKNKETLSDVCVKGRLFGKEVYILKTGIGCMKATFSSAKFLSEYKPDLVINVGCVGSHVNGADYGELIAVENFLGKESFCSEKYQTIPTEEGLLKKLISCFDCPLTVGNIASEDVWRNAGQIKEFTSEHKTVGEDMEGFALAFCAREFSVPFLAVKFVSNNELDGKAYKYDFFGECQQKIFSALEKFFS